MNATETTLKIEKLEEELSNIKMVLESLNSSIDNLTKNDANIYIDTLDSDLNTATSQHRYFAIWTGVIIIILFALYFYFTVIINEKQGEIIKNLSLQNCSTTEIVAYYLGTKFFLGGIITAVFILAFKIIRNSFDQSVRYKKRYHSALFLKYLYAKHNVEKDIDIHKVIEAYRTWTSSIDSAFSINDKAEKEPQPSFLNEFISKFKTSNVEMSAKTTSKE